MCELCYIHHYSLWSHAKIRFVVHVLYARHLKVGHQQPQSCGNCTSVHIIKSGLECYLKLKTCI